MATSNFSALSALRDVEGVLGSFALSTEGALLAKDMPAVFDESVFAEAGPRIARLHEALSVDGDAPESCVMRFGDHKLCLRSNGGTLVCALTSAKINMATLRMALTLVARRLEPERGARSALAAAAADATPLSPRQSTVPARQSTVPPRPSTAPPTTRRPAMYRGRPIESD